MRFLVHILFTIVLCFLLQFFLPWWTAAIGAFIISFLFNEKGIIAFTAGFIAVAILWTVAAGYISITTDAILTSKLNQLLPMNSFIITGLVGGLVGGLGALSGALFRKL